MAAGTSISDSTPPSDSANAKILVASATRTAASRPPSRQRRSSRRRCASVASQCALSGGSDEMDTSSCQPWDVSLSISAIFSAFCPCRSMRSASVLIPRSTRKQSIGPGTAPAAFCRKPAAHGCHDLSRPLRLRPHRSDHRGTWSWSARRCRPQAPVAAAGTASQRCCPRPGAACFECACTISATARMSVTASSGLVGVSSQTSLRSRGHGLGHVLRIGRVNEVKSSP